MIDVYEPVIDIPARLDISARLKDYGLAAVKTHYPNEINEKNADLGRSSREISASGC
jgi:hypothetical protein